VEIPPTLRSVGGRICATVFEHLGSRTQTSFELGCMLLLLTYDPPGASSGCRLSVITTPLDCAGKTTPASDDLHSGHRIIPFPKAFEKSFQGVIGQAEVYDDHVVLARVDQFAKPGPQTRQFTIIQRAKKDAELYAIGMIDQRFEHARPALVVADVICDQVSSPGHVNAS
jgi:hypothetical protein